jgi:hypothetical protein
MSSNKNYVSLVDAINNLEKDPKIKKMLDQIKKERDESPARHQRKFNVELMNVSIEINFLCEQIGRVTYELLNNRDKYDDEETDEMFEYRQKSIHKLGHLQNQYDKKVRELDLAIHNEDALKLRKV